MSVSDILSVFTGDLHATLLPSVIKILITLSPVALVVILFVIAWNLWVEYIRSFNFLNTKYTLLELRLPKDVYKSPLAMETVLHSMHNPSDGSFYNRYWKGGTRPFYSLELVSIEGQVKFFMWADAGRKVGIMNALYSQFPGIEVYEREDYTKAVQFDPNLNKVWAAEYIKSKDKDAYPIKTYIDYGLDKDPKEEYKVDPLSHFLEFLGSIKANHQLWVQFVIRAHNADRIKKGHIFKKEDSWKEDALSEVNKILMRDPKTKVAGIKDEKTGFTKLPTISEGEQFIVKAIERSVTKLPFDVGIRAVYIAPKDTFENSIGGSVGAAFKQYSSESLNGIKSNSKKWHSRLAGVPWEDYKSTRRNKFSRLAISAYRRRSFFYTPFPSKYSVFNTEELATIFHFPSAIAAATPTLERVPSKRSTAPANLPV